MSSRRAFLGLFPAIAGTLQKLAAREVCEPLNYTYALGGNPCDEGKHFKFQKSDPQPRPLWSKMTSAQQSALAAKLQRGYQALIRRSLRNRCDLGGLVGQSWIHFMACSHGVLSGTKRVYMHGSSYFLPWHRAFLYFHERWLQAALDDRSFRIPVWDWESDPALPPIFDWLQIPGPDTPTWGCDYLGRSSVDRIDFAKLQGWLLSHDFHDFAGGNFGGFASGGVHSDVHSQLSGLMRDPQGSALHPIFYMHHANVDRFWDAWWRDYHLYDGFAPNWMKAPMYFADPQHGKVRVYPDQVVQMYDGGDNDHLGYHNTLPAMTFYVPTNICAVTDRGTVSINPNALWPLSVRLIQMTQANPGGVAGELRDRLKELFHGDSMERIFNSVKGGIDSWIEKNEFPVDLGTLKSLLEILSRAFTTLALPIQVKLRLWNIRSGARYPVSLGGIPIGYVAVFGNHHPDTPQQLFCAASIGMAELGNLIMQLRAPGVSLSVAASTSGDPAPSLVSIDGFDILHPRLSIAGTPINDDTLRRYLGLSQPVR